MKPMSLVAVSLCAIAFSPVLSGAETQSAKDVPAAANPAAKVPAKSSPTEPEFRYALNPAKPYPEKAFRRRESEAAAARGKTFDLLMLGDSLTWNWEVSRGRAQFAELTNRYSVVNMGIAGDRVEHLLWRCRNGEIDGYKAKAAMLLIGTNNMGRHEVADIFAGICLVIDEIANRQPGARLIMLPVFPRGQRPGTETRAKISRLNVLLKAEAKKRGAYWMDFTDKLVEPDGTISKSMMDDYLHIGPTGYAIWRDAICEALCSLGVGGGK